MQTLTFFRSEIRSIVQRLTLFVVSRLSSVCFQVFSCHFKRKTRRKTTFNRKFVICVSVTVIVCLLCLTTYLCQCHKVGERIIMQGKGGRRKGGREFMHLRMLRGPHQASHGDLYLDGFRGWGGGERGKRGKKEKRREKEKRKKRREKEKKKNREKEKGEKGEREGGEEEGEERRKKGREKDLLSQRPATFLPMP